MSWLSELTNYIGGSVGLGDKLGDSISDALPDLGLFGNSPGGNQTSLWPSLITAGAGLANSYFQQSSGADLAEQYAKQQQAMLEAQLAAEDRKLAAQKEVAAMYAGAQVKAAGIAAGSAKRNTLANLYNNWATLTQRAGESEGQMAQNIGAMVGRSLDARQASLK